MYLCHVISPIAFLRIVYYFYEIRQLEVKKNPLTEYQQEGWKFLVHL